jgi:hypothetical protein
MAAIKDIGEFSKLFRVRVPLEREFDYYISTLCRSREYSWLEGTVRAFAGFESELGDTPVGSYKMEMLRRLKTALADTQVFAAFSAADAGCHYPTLRRLSQHRGDFLLSLDVPSANYTILKCFDEAGDLPDRWEDFCAVQRVHPVLAASKSYRQLVFGNLSADRSQRLQHAFITGFLKVLEEGGLGGDRIVFISADELVLRLGSTEGEATETEQNVWDLVRGMKGHDVSAAIPAPLRLKVPLKGRVFRLNTTRVLS